MVVLCSLFNIYVVSYTPSCDLCYFILISRFIYKFKGKKIQKRKKKNHTHSQCSFGVCFKRKNIKFRINNDHTIWLKIRLNKTFLHTMRWLCVVSGVEKHCLIVIKSEDGKYLASYGRKINFDIEQKKKCYVMFL